jgi:hypothetical protein
VKIVTRRGPPAPPGRAGPSAAPRRSRAAGAAIVAGVLTGTGTRAELEAAGTTHVLDGVGQLAALVITDDGA